MYLTLSFFSGRDINIDDILKDFGSTSAYHHQRVSINNMLAFKYAWETRVRNRMLPVL